MNQVDTPSCTNEVRIHLRLAESLRSPFLKDTGTKSN